MHNAVNSYKLLFERLPGPFVVSKLGPLNVSTRLCVLGVEKHLSVKAETVM